MVLILITLLLLYTAGEIYPNERIHLNQMGFHSAGPKIAVVVSPNTWYFSVKSTDLSVTYYSGELSKKKYWVYSKDTVAVADFSFFMQPGRYVVYIAGIGASTPFTISETAFKDAVKGLIRAFYYQRASVGLEPVNAGKWSRAAGHEDKNIIVHSSAASDPQKPLARKEGETFPSSKGWYDAGDYGKYVVNAGITTYQLLLLFDRFRGYFEKFNLNIPESGNSLPDLLDEIKWEIDWLLTMQDPADGGVYHKVTAKRFCGDVMPSDDRDSRYFIGKGAAATFDFAAVCAAAYRIYKQYLPQYADSCLNAALYAWKWGIEHPDSAFKNPADVVTGVYGDRNLRDERFWAAAELFITTGDSVFYREIKDALPSFDVPSWQNVAMLGCYSLALVKGDSLSEKIVINTAEALLRRTETSPYRTSIGSEFYWGSNGVAANQGMVMLIAYLLSGDVSYLEGAIHSCDYLFGRNAVGYSFVTGFGTRTPQNPHHRPSTADGITEPVPGFLVGGPNAQSLIDEGCGVELPEAKAKAWIDRSCSYTTNEVAINWNAPAAFLTGGIEAIFNDASFDLQPLLEKYQPDTQPPKNLTIDICDIGADRARVKWKASEATAVTIAYKPVASDKESQKKICCDRADSGETEITGLLPETVYKVKVYAADKSGNITSVTDSFKTEEYGLNAETVYKHNRSEYIPNSELKISFNRHENIGAKLICRVGGSAIIDTIDFYTSDGEYTAVIPPEKVTEAGLTYAILIRYGGAEISTTPFSISPATAIFNVENFSRRKTYRLVSLPGFFGPIASVKAFSAAMGDTADWRFFGFDAENSSYILYDSLRSGFGGWLFHKKDAALIHRCRTVPPDSLFPVVLRSGWNCIGNPFSYPVFWDNSMIVVNGALLRITDPAASVFVRRQYFGYLDTTPDGVNNGTYYSNRDLETYEFDESAKIDSWTAYWVYTEKDSVCLLIDPSPKRVMTTVLPKRKTDRRPGWLLTIRLTCGELCDGPLAVGALDGGLEGYDQYDVPKPPSPDAGLCAGFPHPEWGRPASLYAADIVEYDRSSDQKWILNIKYRQKYPLTLSWRRTGERKGTLKLIDPKNGATVSVDEAEKYTFINKDNSETNGIIFMWEPEGLSDGREERAWSFKYRSGGNIHRFFYTIPAFKDESYNVSIRIYDFKGRLISRVTEQIRQPGFYTALWDGMSENGKPVGSGVYICRITAADFSESIVFKNIR